LAVTGPAGAAQKSRILEGSITLSEAADDGQPLDTNKSNNARQSHQSSGDERALAALHIHDSLRNAKSLDEAVQQICSALITKLSLLIMTPVHEILSSNSLAHYGMDSLVAVEMRNWLGREVEVTVPIPDLLANQPILQLSEKLAQRSKLVQFDSDEEFKEIEE
jgi:hypothetical protein